MHETKEKIKKICEMKEKLTCWAHGEVEKGKEQVCTEEMGKVIDMIKDLAEAEEKCWKACYYKKLIEEMEFEPMMGLDAEDLEHLARMGYDHYRYSSGRFAPKGRGHYSRSGYMMPEMPRTVDDFRMGEMADYGRYGYDGRSGASSRSGSMSDGRGSTHSQAYDRYKNAWRHYTETGDPEDKSKMSEHAKEHAAETVETMRDIWQNADPDLRRQLKSNMVSLVNEMS